MNKKIKLKDLCVKDEVGKYGIPAPAEDFDSQKVRYLRISDISDDGVLLNTDKKSVSDVNISKYILKQNDIVFARTGNSTGRAYFHEDSNGVLAFAGFLIKYGLDKNKVNPKYLKYFTISKEYKTWVKNLSLGSTRGNISAQTFADCPILLPKRQQQNIIVNTLSSLDCKIALDCAINHNLEAMVKQLYDYWFVQFDFPNEEGKPYKSSGGEMYFDEHLKRNIPLLWKGCFVCDIANITMGQSPDGSSYNEDRCGVLFYQGSTDFGIRFPSVRQYTTAPSRYAQKGDILMSVRAPVGAVNIANNDCCIGRGLAALNSKIGSTTHLYYIIDGLRSAFEQRNTAGTTFGSITKDDLHNLPIIKPSDSVISTFESLCKPIFDKQMVIGKEIDSLIKQRDELLPLLMNGQVSVNYDLSHD